MHFYPFHMGDYLKSTAHLTDEEDLCYRRLMDMYYDTESPISTDIKMVARRIRRTIEVVQVVLEEFFELQEDGWHNIRCDGELSKYWAIQEGGRKGAYNRWHKGGDRGAIGGALPTQSEANANQEPRTKNQLFMAPSVSDVTAYMGDRGLVNGEAAKEAQGFCDHHTARGWIMSNGKKMRDWKAACRTWLSNREKWNPKPPAVKVDYRALDDKAFWAFYWPYREALNCPSLNGLRPARQDAERYLDNHFAKRGVYGKV